MSPRFHAKVHATTHGHRLQLSNRGDQKCMYTSISCHWAIQRTELRNCIAFTCGKTKKLVVFSRFLFLGSGGGLVLCFTKSMSEDGPQSCAEDSSDHVAFSRTY